MALRRIALRDFVIVESLDTDLDAGFTVLTGETGAGKSILIDAVQLALGARADAGTVREGAERAEIAVEFDAAPASAAILDEAGIDAADTLLLRRTIDRQGRSRAWINGSPVTAAQLRAVGEPLLDIHGQHAWQSLTRPDAVRGLLDAYAGLDTAPLRAAWSVWRDAQRAQQDAADRQAEHQDERERLQWQMAELEKLAPADGEWEALNTLHARLANSQGLLRAAAEAGELLSERDGTSAVASLSQAESTLRAQAGVEPEFATLADILASAVAQAQDVAHSLGAYPRRIDVDPDALADADARIAAWLSLARRFRRQPEQLPALATEWRDRLAALEAGSDGDALAAATARAAADWKAAAAKVTKARAKAAPALARSVTQAMQGLGMAGGRFEVQLDPLAEPALHGSEDVAFLVAGHAGSTPRPVGRVASGGELSRIALAIAVTTSALGGAGTLIFDEVDSGVGGAVADTVGRLMKQLGRSHQVLAVTHLPQVAACADHHLVVRKQAGAAGRTTSTVVATHGEQRVGEVARMLAGERLSGTTLAHARELLQASDAGAGHG